METTHAGVSAGFVILHATVGAGLLALVVAEGRRLWRARRS